MRYNDRVPLQDPQRQRMDVSGSQELWLVSRVGTSAGLKVGQSVFAIGTPLGFSRTLTAGVVSGLDRSIPSPAGTITRGAIQVLCCVGKIVRQATALHDLPQPCQLHTLSVQCHIGHARLSGLR